MTVKLLSIVCFPPVILSTWFCFFHCCVKHIFLQSQFSLKLNRHCRRCRRKSPQPVAIANPISESTSQRPLRGEQWRGRHQCEPQNQVTLIADEEGRLLSHQRIDEVTGYCFAVVYRPKKKHKKKVLIHSLFFAIVSSLIKLQQYKDYWSSLFQLTTCFLI